MNLFEIDENLRELLDNGFNSECIDQETGEIDEQKAAELINSYQADLDHKIESIGLFILELKSKDKEYKEYIESVKKRQDRNKKKLESLEKYLTNYMEQSEVNKFETKKIDIRFRKSSSCNVLDSEKVPSQYKHIETTEKVDKAQILKDLRSGNTVDGCELVENKSIQIK